MGLGDTYKTCQKSPANARYKWVKYTDGTTSPKPTSEEMIIPLDRGEHFPPVRSCNKGAIWEMISYA